MKQLSYNGTNKWKEEKKTQRNKALEVAEKAKDLPHLKNKHIKYDLKR